MRLHRCLLVASLLVGAIGCGSSDDGPVSAPPAELPTSFGGDRPVELIVPSGYDPATPAPLLMLLHGRVATGFLQEVLFRFAPAAEANGVLYLYPDGTIDAGGDRFWNATDLCCDRYDSGVDDAGYPRGLVDEVSAAYNVDPKRIYFAGHSNGGFMSYRMACDYADLVAGIAPIAGASYADNADCAASEPVTVVHVHGTEDASVPYLEGDYGYGPHPGATGSVARWAELNGCSSEVDELAARDLDADISGTETRVEAHRNCPGGGATELWTVQDAGHVPGFSDDFAHQLMRFLLEHPKR
jgi:polyhydroxybutyrate depolymerase